MPSKRVLITGITGFVGSRLAKRLIDLDYEVYGLVRKRSDRTYFRLNWLKIHDKVKLIEGDLTNLYDVLNAVDKSEPDIIFHLGAQTFVPRSVSNPLETFYINCLGTQNILEAVRLKDLDCKIHFAGSSEEYGLQFISEDHYRKCLEKYKVIHPPPTRLPELPIDENNPLRPMSPYAVSKVYGDYLMRNYYLNYGLKTYVTRAFNHEGAGRGTEFVTSQIVMQCVELMLGKRSKIEIGNVNVFRDWSHVDDIVEGYINVVEHGREGDVYVLGSARTNSVLTYILLTLKLLGYEPLEIETIKSDKRVKDPLEPDESPIFGVKFWKSKIDKMLIEGELEYDLADKGILVKTPKGNVTIEFSAERFRHTDVPILLSNPKKAVDNIGFRVTRTLEDIVRDQINYFLALSTFSLT